MATDWGELAGRAAAAYASGGASEAQRSQGGGGGLVDGNRFGPVIVGTGFSKIAASLSAPGGDVLPGLSPASQLLADDSGVSIGGRAIPATWLYIGAGLAIALLIARRRRK